MKKKHNILTTRKYTNIRAVHSCRGSGHKQERVRVVVQCLVMSTTAPLPPGLGNNERFYGVGHGLCVTILLSSVAIYQTFGMP